MCAVLLFCCNILQLLLLFIRLSCVTFPWDYILSSLIEDLLSPGKDNRERLCTNSVKTQPKISKIFYYMSIEYNDTDFRSSLVWNGDTTSNVSNRSLWYFKIFIELFNVGA